MRGRHTGRAAHVPDMQGQQLPVANLHLRHGLGVVSDELAIVIEVLGGGFDARLGLDGAPERLDRHIRVDFERDEVLVVAPLLGVGDAECDPPEHLGSACAMAAGGNRAAPLQTRNVGM